MAETIPIMMITTIIIVIIAPTAIKNDQGMDYKI